MRRWSYVRSLLLLQVAPSVVSPQSDAWTCRATKVCRGLWSVSAVTWHTWRSWRAWTFTYAAWRAATSARWVSLNRRSVPQVSLTEPNWASPCRTPQPGCCPSWRRWRSSTCRPIRRRVAWCVHWSPPFHCLRWGDCPSTAAAWARIRLLRWVRRNSTEQFLHFFDHSWKQCVMSRVKKSIKLENQQELMFGFTTFH